MPGSLSGSLITSTNTSVSPNVITISLVVITNIPKHLTWKGNVSGDWDTATTNWLDQDTLLYTNFSIGDFVQFDDSTAASSVNLADPLLLPGSVTMSNSANHYVFSGSGGIQGSAILAKTGTNVLEINGSTTLSVQVNQGSLVGNSLASIGSASIAAGTSMSYTGIVNNGVNCAGVAILAGSTAGTLTMQSPSATVTNLGTFSGSLVFQSGTLLYNSGALANIGSSTVVSNSTLINVGSIGQDSVNGVLTVNGTFRDLGLGNIYLTTFSLGNGGQFIPGGDGIGTSTVLPNGVGTFPGRVQLLPGSTSLFKVDPGAPANTLLLSGTQDFGPSQSSIQFNGCTLVISNVSGSPFTAGQSFKMFGNSGNGGDIFDSGSSTNSYPILQPVTPGFGLAWDLTRLRPQGIIAINAVATNPVQIAFSMTHDFSVNTNGAGSTNPVVLAHLHWPTNYIGWRLQQQVNPLSIGLSTNWDTVATAVFTNDVTLTNSGGAGSVFYRMIYP